jgi:hypothetical protein
MLEVHKPPEYNSPPAPPSGRSGGTLDKPWTRSGTIEPPQTSVFDQPHLFNSLYPRLRATRCIAPLSKAPPPKDLEFFRAAKHTNRPDAATTTTSPRAHPASRFAAKRVRPDSEWFALSTEELANLLEEDWRLTNDLF